MNIPFLTRRPLLNKKQQKQIVTAIQAAEKRTSGEIRVYVEKHCPVDPLNRSTEIFKALKMEETKDRNAVLVYIALRDRKMALYGDKGIHGKVGTDFWNRQVRNILSHFSKADYAGGLATVVTEIGETLHQHFPYDRNTDINELPDDIVFGK